MKANELRIGNLVYGVITHRVIKSINEDYYTDTYNNSTLIRDAKPIPLTEEWLLKFGFKNGRDENFIIKDKEGYYISVKYRQNIHGEYGWAFSNDESDANCYILTTVKYVHSLQNLYFALTGEELTIS